MIRALGSIRLALVGMLLLAIGAALSYDNPVGTPVWVLVAPLAFLAVNLLAAIATNPRINRRGGLLVFHLGLLAIIVLAGIGRLTHLDAQLEITEGAAFSPSDMTHLAKGPWHSGALEQLAFVQGSFTVDYSPGMVRGLTHSTVFIPQDTARPSGPTNDSQSWQTKVVGDDRPLKLEGYRFYTTFNKGFAPVLTWIPDGGGEALSGTIHMPSYPLFDYKQESSWTPPNEKGVGKEIKFWLRLKTAPTMGVEPGLARLCIPSERNEQQGDSMRRSLTIRCRAIRAVADAGMTTAEYAVGTLAACAFAAVLMAVVRSGAIKSALTGLITSALSIAS